MEISFATLAYRSATLRPLRRKILGDARGSFITMSGHQALIHKFRESCPSGGGFSKERMPATKGPRGLASQWHGMYPPDLNGTLLAPSAKS